MKKKGGKKKPSIRKLVKKLDTIFSIYIRKKYADRNGFVRCFTCGVVKPWQDMQNSHYHSRRHMGLRFDETNCHPACLACNVFLHGNMPSYAIQLIETYGDSILRQLEAKKNTIKKWTSLELEQLIEQYSK